MTVGGSCQFLRKNWIAVSAFKEMKNFLLYEFDELSVVRPAHPLTGIRASQTVA